ncbi:oligopeptide transporter 5-like [Salvia hispanica]|uniref:oligopeptide transporter 5-like n=1 Tax=Salvia hispanica TaxID=49212 RepID=UPI002009282A|nr:oligopeptide transporter 5-like [Salvia hispanica]XP_047965147.1 oligopeptide transporter 5-like [Salvia hispanica]
MSDRNRNHAGDQSPPHHNLQIEDSKEEEDEDEECPIEQVRLTVPETDDPTVAALTFRTWFLGIITCVMLSFSNQFFGYRQNSLVVSSVAAQIVTLPIGKFMARVLPTTSFRVPFTEWSFSLNPGAFTIKEHVLITIFANCGAEGVYAVSIVTIVKALYHRPLNPIAAWLLVQSTQMLGYGWAGIFRRMLVDSPYMWWPGNMTSVSLFRTLHEEDTRKKGGLTRLQFFVIVFTTSFAYYVVPAYFFPTISSLSLLCYIGKDSILMQQLGSGLHGMGIGSFTFDWATVSFIGDPIATPGFAIINVVVGFILVMYVVTPITYFNNIYQAKKFPFFSSATFDDTGMKYNISRVLNEATFSFDVAGYEAYSKLHVSAFFAFTYGIGFAMLSATIVHVALYHGKTIWALWTKTKSKFKLDVHTRLMKKNYESVPDWWFHSILALVFGLSLFACEGFGKQLQLPWWGLILACAMAFFFTLPVGIIQATTNMQIGLNVITEMLIGFIYPGKPLANVAFKTYGYISMAQALTFLADFKLGHYMKIPPKSMFVAQLVGTVVASSVYFATAWWLLSTIGHICDAAALPEGSPWTCPSDNVFYNSSIIWGVIGPLRMFTSKGVYGLLNWWFLVGAVAPLPAYFLSRRYPEKKWVRMVNVPLILGATASMPPARSVNYVMWGAVGVYFNVYVYRVNKRWWARYAYVMSAAINAGIAFMAIVMYFALQSYDVSINWWGLDIDDHCPLASCPTAPGVAVEGCPVH